jgi:hypothetical protein
MQSIKKGKLAHGVIAAAMKNTKKISMVIQK